MKLYKFRSLQNLEFTLDILLNERLYCSRYEDLNDPYEGTYIQESVHRAGTRLRAKPLTARPLTARPLTAVPLGQSPDPNDVVTRRSLVSLPDTEVMRPGRICSLSFSFKDVRLWSHYAAGHTGIAIEVDLPEDSPELHRVKYVDNFRAYKAREETDATEILSTKSEHWLYEKEFRVIFNKEYYPVKGLITGVYLGLRLSDVHKKILLSLLPSTIPVYATRLNERPIEIAADGRVGS